MQDRIHRFEPEDLRFQFQITMNKLHRLSKFSGSKQLEIHDDKSKLFSFLFHLFSHNKTKAFIWKNQYTHTWRREKKKGWPESKYPLSASYSQNPFLRLWIDQSRNQQKPINQNSLVFSIAGEEVSRIQMKLKTMIWNKQAMKTEIRKWCD